MQKTYIDVGTIIRRLDSVVRDYVNQFISSYGP